MSVSTQLKTATLSVSDSQLWDAIATAEAVRDLRAHGRATAQDEHNSMCDAIGEMLDAGRCTLAQARSAWAECDAKLARAMRGEVA